MLSPSKRHSSLRSLGSFGAKVRTVENLDFAMVAGDGDRGTPGNNKNSFPPETPGQQRKNPRSSSITTPKRETLNGTISSSITTPQRETSGTSTVSGSGEEEAA